MKLNHLALPVTDVLATSNFLEKYFSLKPLASGNPNINMALMNDDNGSVISMFKGEEVQYPEPFHIGFIQENEARVNEVHARLKADGFEADEPQPLHGTYTFYFKSPFGFTIEVLSILK